MARLDILVHEGCLSEQPARALARDLRREFPHWHIDVPIAELIERDQFGVLAFPVFLYSGQIVTTGFPRKDWLVAELRAWENGER